MEWKGEVGEEGESGGDVRAVIGTFPHVLLYFHLKCFWISKTLEHAVIRRDFG
jgi:hypothetical protein